MQALEASRAREVGAVKGPGGVREADLLPEDRGRDRDGGIVRRITETLEIIEHGRGEARMLRARDMDHAAEGEVGQIGHGKARIGAADIGDDGTGRNVCHWRIPGF